MAPALITFAIAFLLICGAGFIVTYRPATLRRLARAVAAPAEVDVRAAMPAPPPGEKVAKIVGPFQHVLPKTREEVSVIQKRLARAGYREKNFLGIFYGAKVLVPLLSCLFVALTGLYAVGGYFCYVVALGIGFLLPDFWLGNRIKARQTNLRLGLPDALDLIIICIEAGLGMDRAILRATEERRAIALRCLEELRRTHGCGFHTRACVDTDSRGQVWDQCGAGPALACAVPAHTPPPGCGGAGGAHHGEADLPPGAVHFSGALRGHARSFDDRDHGADAFAVELILPGLKEAPPVADKKRGGYDMDNGTLVQVIAGVLFVVCLVFLIQRRRRKVS
jgi:hypothetical protein